MPIPRLPVVLARLLPMAALFVISLAGAKPLEIGTIALRMDPTDAEVLVRKDPNDKSSFAVTLLDGDKSLPGRIKTSGSSSKILNKRSFYIKLDKGFKWHGQSRLSLNAMGSDPTLMRNKLVWDIYHEIGVVGPQNSYQRVVLNGKPQGLFLQIDWIEGKMFERSGLGGDGELYHPQDSHYCGDLTAHRGYDTDDCWFKFSPPFDDYSSLEKLMERIAATPVSRFDTFLSETFDVDSVLNWLALNVLAANGDSYNKNYFLYRSKVSGKWHVVPWDYDLTFGRTYDTYLPYPRSIYNDRFMYFYPPELGAYSPLKEKTLRNPVMLAKFRARLAHLLGLKRELNAPGYALFAPEQMSARIAELRQQLLPEVKRDPYLRQNPDDFLENVAALNHFVRARSGYLATAVVAPDSWNPELAYWHPEQSPRPLPYPERLQATATDIGTVAVVADGFGYLLGMFKASDPAVPISMAAESTFGQTPRLIPPGTSAKNCIQRTWFVTFRFDAPQLRGSLTLEYLQENSVLHELGGVSDEKALRLWRYERGQWQMVDAHVNTLANTLTANEIEFMPESTMRFVACTPESAAGTAP